MIISNIDFDIDIKHPILVIDRETLSYIGGLIDGEGSIGVLCTNGRKPQPRFQIGISDKDIIYWVYNTVGKLGSVHHRKVDNPHRKDVYQLTIMTNQCLLFLSVIKDFLKIKKAQAELVLEVGMLVKNKSPNEIRILETLYKLKVLNGTGKFIEESMRVYID